MAGRKTLCFLTHCLLVFEDQPAAIAGRGTKLDILRTVCVAAPRWEGSERVGLVGPPVKLVVGRCGVGWLGGWVRA